MENKQNSENSFLNDFLLYINVCFGLKLGKEKVITSKSVYEIKQGEECYFFNNESEKKTIAKFDKILHGEYGCPHQYYSKDKQLWNYCESRE